MLAIATSLNRFEGKSAPMGTVEKPAIGVVGVGWVGLVTAACFAELGHEVRAMDVDAAKIEALGSGAAPPIHEPGLAELLERNRERLRFTTEMGDAARAAAACSSAASTPRRPTRATPTSRASRRSSPSFRTTAGTRW